MRLLEGSTYSDLRDAGTTLFRGQRLFQEIWHSQFTLMCRYHELKHFQNTIYSISVYSKFYDLKFSFNYLCYYNCQI